MLSTRVSCELEVCICSLSVVFQIKVPRQRSLKLTLCETKLEGKSGLLLFGYFYAIGGSTLK